MKTFESKPISTKGMNYFRNPVVLQKQGKKNVKIVLGQQQDTGTQKAKALRDYQNEWDIFLLQETKDRNRKKVKKDEIKTGLADRALSQLKVSGSLGKLAKDKSPETTNSRVIVWTSASNPTDRSTRNADGKVVFGDPVEEFDHLIKQLESNDFSSIDDKEEAIIRAKELLPFSSSDYDSGTRVSLNSYLTDADLGRLEQLNRRGIRSLNEDRSDPSYIPSEKNSTGHVNVHRV